MSDVFEVENREQLGTRQARRLRESSLIPAVLYGHGEKSVTLTIPEDQVDAAIRHQSQMIKLEGAAKGNALIKDVQWDAFGQNVLHLDLLRVDATEKVEVETAIDLRGAAPGVKEGGVVAQVIFQLEIRCPAGAIPDSIEVNINELNLHDTITVGDLDLPADVEALVDDGAIVVQCVEPQLEPEEEEETAAIAPGEPEVIGREDDEEGEEGEAAAED